ncbi:YdgA family protein [Actinobacillus arthritidis]|uniref:YdgA family protein n=1 Tax=Actinobacillus arthritidis TaxID=157339 RepID=UPI002441E73C|nr:YdgA family protein [Actinobacillus arthritidis]WGE89825.1 YdgA family protein [Actinobacillus arthritidis]
MKKSTVAVSIIVALAAMTTGGAWYTGNQIEQRYPQLLEQANHHLKSLNIYSIDANISDVKLTKGIFSSEVQYQVNIKESDATLTFKGNDKVYHGPIPLNRLMKGNLMPMLLSGETHISAVDEKIKTYFANNDVLTAVTDVNYSGEVAGNATLNPVKTDKVETSKIHFEGDYSGFGKQKFTADLIRFKNADANPEQNHEKIEITDLNYDANYVKDKQYPTLQGIGDYHLSFKKLALFAENNQTVNLNEFISKGNSKIENGRLLSSGNFSVKADLAENNKTADLGKIQTDISMEVDAKAFNDLRVLSDKLESESPEVQQQIQAIVMALVTQSPKLKINEFSLENAKGKNTLSLNLDLDKFDMLQMSQAESIQDTLKIFKPSNLNVNLNLGASEEVAKQWLTLYPEHQAGTAEENAKALVQELTHYAQSSGLASVDAEKIKMALAIENGKVMLNGREVSEAELQMALFAIMFGTGDLGQ